MTDSFYDPRHVPSGVRAARAPAPEGGRTDGAPAPDPRLELDTFLVSKEEIPIPFDFSPEVYRATIHDYGDGLCEVSYRLIPEEWKNSWGSGNYQQTVRGDSDNREVNEENAVRRAKSKARKLIITMRANHLLTLTFRERIDDLQVAWKRFEQFIRFVHERYPQWQYVAAPELQKRGSWHFHVAVKGFQDIGYAGVTRGQMRQLATEISNTGEMTIGQSKSIVTELVASGRIGAQAIGEVAKLAGDYAFSTGQNIDKIAPQLVKLFDDPAKGAEALNNQMHFLTVADMDYIRTLENQGQVQEAQLVLAQKLNEQLPKHTENLGYLEKAWNATRNAASSAWDAMLGIGRQATLEDRLNEVQDKLAKMRSGNYSTLFFGSESSLMAQEARLKMQLGMEKSAAAAKASAAANVEEAQSVDKLIKGYSLAAQREEVRQKIARMERHPEIPNQADAIAQARKQLANIGKNTDSKKLENAFETSHNQFGGDNAKLQAEIDWMQKYGLATGHANQALIEFETTYGKLKALPDSQKAQLLDMAKQKDNLELAKKNLEGYLKLQQDLSNTVVKNQKAISDVQNQPTLLTMRERDRVVLEATNKLENEAIVLRQKAFQDIKAPSLYAKALNDINTALDAQKKQMADATASVYDYSHSWEFGATKAVNDYLDAVNNMAASSNRLFTDMFKGMEDAAVNFVKTGKVDFASLADSIVSDLIRIQMQQNVTKPLATWMSGMTGGNTQQSQMLNQQWSIWDNLATAFQANGGAWENGVQAFAAGGVFTNTIVDQPTLFKFSNGTGLMGEAGPEAIMPLTRDSSGRLGVRAQGGGVSVPLTVNIIESPGNGGKVQQRQDSGGRNVLDVFVESVKGAIASDIVRGSGPVPAALTATYGLNRAPGAY